MSANFAKPTYEELLKTLKDQELQIDRLIKKERSLTNLSFYFKESLDLVCIAGTDGFLKEINPAFMNILGYTKLELLSSPFTTFIHPADIAATNAEIKRLSKGKSSVDFENRYLKKNGDIVYITWTASVDFSNEIIYAIGRDFTEKKQVREKLNASIKAETELSLKLVEEESNHKFKNYIENAPDGVFVADTNGNFVEVNEAVTLIWGYPKEELLTFSMMDLICQESLDDWKSCLKSLKRVGGSKGEFKIIHKSGEIRWSGVDSVKLSENRFLCFIKDITEIKRANELLSNTFEHITDAFAALDNNWCYSYMNKKAGQILDCNPIEMIGKHIWTEFPDAINGDFYCACHNSAATQVASHFEDYHESSQLWVENHIYPSENGISYFFTDITEKKKSEEIIKKSEKHFRALVENNEGIITVVDENLKVLFRSPSSARVTGYTDKEFDEIPDEEYFHADYLEYIYKIIQNAINNPGKLLPALFRVKHKSGHYIWLEGIINNRFNDSSVNGIISNFRDVTDRMESISILKKERDVFAKIAATSPGLIYSMRQNFDGSLSYPYASDAIKGIYGFSFKEVASNANIIFDLIHPDDLTGVVAKIINTKTKLVPLKGEYRYFHPTKGLVWHEVNSLPVVEPEGTVICHGTVTDITERKNVEGLIIKEKLLSEKIISNLPGIFYLYNESGKFVKWNKNFELMTGYGSHEIKTMRPSDFFKVIEKERIEKRIKAILGHNSPNIEDKPPGIEVEFYTKNKNKVPYFIDSLAIEYEGEKCVFGIGLDLTEKKKSEEELKVIYEKMEAVFDAIPDLLFELGMDGHIHNFYSRLNDLPEIYSKSIIGKTFFDILPSEAADVAISAIREAYENGFSNGRQYSIELPTGKSWFELSIAPMKESEAHDIHFICLSREITAAKKGDEALLQSEGRYRGLLDNLDAGVVVHAPNASIIMSNQKACELLGLSANQIIGLQAIDSEWRFLNEDGSSMDAKLFPVNQIVKTKQSLKNILVGVSRPLSSDVAWLLASGYPFFDNKGDLAEIVISFIDITDRKLLETELLKSKEQSENANKSKTDFLANMSHEIRTPLNAIIGYTHLLMKPALETNQSEYISTINESATSLLDIVNDILDFSKIESGKLELSTDNLDLFKLSDQVIDLFKYQALKKEIDLVLHMDPEVPQFILADSVRLKQILVNLLSNAFKFTNTGVIRLDIDVIPNNSRDSSRIKFSVKDTGIGIKGSNNLKIFQSFVQEDNSVSRKFGGTGLGLPISNQLLALMNSKLNLISKYGEGSDFFFEIDFRRLNDSEILNAKIDNVNTDGSSNFLHIKGHKKVLIVEDNRINMLLVKTLVQTLIPDCVIYEAKDGNEAVDLYKKEIPDIILMDIQMPNKNGYEATVEIRQLKDSAEIPIIAVTAGIMAEDKQKCLEAGLNDYLSKPIIESELKRVLVKWLVK
jgi:PAS domain S-box-containing protein